MWFRAFGNDSWTWATENLESCKQSLMSNSGGSSDQKADRNVGSKFMPMKFQIGMRKDSFENWSRNLSCYIVAKNFSTYCSCPRLCGSVSLKVMY
jgi:hypothetical protein